MWLSGSAASLFSVPNRAVQHKRPKLAFSVARLRFSFRSKVRWWLQNDSPRPGALSYSLWIQRLPLAESAIWRKGNDP